MRQNSSSNFDILVPAKAKNGISYNVFSKFELSRKPLTIVNTDDTSGGIRGTGKADLIVIESNNISLKNQFTILGPSADILFITRSASGKLSCEQCSFDNVGRVTMAAATPSYAPNAKTINSVGDLTTVGGGKVSVKGLVSPGLQSLELIAENMDTSGIIDTNLRANNHSESGMIIAERGSEVVGAGGINMFTGRLKVSYADLAVRAATLSTAWSTIKGKFRAATITIASPNNIAIDADMSTMSDALSTSQHHGKLYAPEEGIFVQSLGKYKRSSQQNIHINANARLASDNHLSLKSSSTIRILNQGNKQAKVIGGDITLIARNDVHQQGYIIADDVKISANQFINNGVVESASIDVQTEKSIYNSFGGKVLGKNVTLYSKSGAVINGSRADKTVYLDDALTIGGEGYEVNKQFGILQSLKELSVIKTAIGASTVSASIFADNINIQAKRIENINPYHLVKTNSVNWDAGIRVDGIKANQVAIEAERSLKLRASEYVLNSSAIIGLNSDGEFLVNSPVFSNERYEISFESYPYRIVEYSSDNNKKDMSNYKYGTETKILTYSPPGRVYSFGDFQFSRGGTNDVKEMENSKLFNKVSYLQIFKDSSFFNSDIKSISLAIGSNYTKYDFKGVTDCLKYQKCNLKDVMTRTDLENLLSLKGNVSGVKGQLNSEVELTVANIEPLFLDVKKIINNIVSNYVEKNKVSLEDYFNINNKSPYGSIGFFNDLTDYEFQLHDLSRIGDYVEGKVRLCYTLKKEYHSEAWAEAFKEKTCHQNHKKLKENWKLIYDELLAKRKFGSTGYTLSQLEEAAERYLSFTFGTFKTVKEAEEYERARLNVGLSTPDGAYSFLRSYTWFIIDTSGDETVNIIAKSNRIEIAYRVFFSFYSPSSGMTPDDEGISHKKVQLELGVLEKFINHNSLGEEIKNKNIALTKTQQITAINNLLRTITPEGSKQPIVADDEEKFSRIIVYESHEVNGSNVKVNFKRIYPRLILGGPGNYSRNKLEYKKVNESIVVTQGQLSHYLDK
ncbi:FhaB protein [Vibrio sp. AND4]|nr:FhaB protein [Vibrio sp. AND4]